MSKTLCKKKKKQKDITRFNLNVEDPRFVCEKCGRMARKKKKLCRPTKMIA